MSELEHIFITALTAIGFFLMGAALQIQRITYWRIKWIEMEHILARLQNREPRDISSAEISKSKCPNTT